MDDDASPIASLVAAASAGDQQAWRELVDRYSPRLLTVIRRFRLSPSETEDVAQTVWLRLVEYLGNLREPRAIPRWIITTGRRESIRYLSTQHRLRPSDPMNAEYLSVAAGGEDPDEELFRLERHEALLAGLAELPARQAAKKAAYEPAKVRLSKAVKELVAAVETRDEQKIRAGIEEVHSSYEALDAVFTG
ncbi:MAG: sigma-70 family RNA polymerase sigma factor [Acidobacteria bacterium]|nr:MAG: sigma-70 family RNA polymerase sigma factor [Acidobacteriota bacterium]